MKKFSLIVVGIIATCLVTLRTQGTQVLAEEKTEPSIMDLVKEANYEVIETDKPKSAILIDANTGKFLWGENEETPHNPASIMKLMSIYLVYEAIEKGQFTMDTMVEATERHQQIANIYEISNNKIVSGVSYPVKELLPMALVPSSNVATMMLAELVEPDAGKFLKMMNDKAQELGMTKTKIVNATGAEISSFQGLYANDGVDTSSLEINASNETTAKDFSIFTYNLLKNYPQILDFTNKPTVTVMKDTPNEETFDTYNYSIPHPGKEYEKVDGDYSFDGVDGLKTGSSPSGAFNIDMTAKRGDLRLITVVFGVGDWSDQTGEYKRHPFGNAILNYGFNHFEYKELVKKGEQSINEKEVVVSESLYDVVKKGDTPKIIVNENKTITLDNSLKPVTGKIKPVETKYKNENQTNSASVLGTTKKKTESIMETIKKHIIDMINKVNKIVDMSNPIIKVVVISFSIIILLMLILIILLVKSSRRRKRIKRNQTRRSRGRSDNID